MADHIRTRPLGPDGEVVLVAADEVQTRNGATLEDSEFSERVKVTFGADGDQQDVSEATGHRLPVADTAVATALVNLLAAVDGLEGLDTTLNAKDFATQTTLAAVLAKLTSDPATQTTLAAVLTALQGTPNRAIPAQAASSRRSVGSGSFAATALRGLAVRETSGTTAALVNIYAGTDNTGVLLVPLALAPGESVRETFGAAGVGQSGSGTNITNLYLEVASGTVVGSVFV